MAPRKTTRKTTNNEAAVAAEATAEKNIFQKMAELHPVTVIDVETEAGVVHMRTRITLAEVSYLVNTIVDMCVDDKTGEVRWDLVDYVSKLMIVSAYCGIPLPDAEVGYMGAIGEGRLYHAVADHIDMQQRRTILDAVTDKLHARQEMNVAVGVGRLNQLLDSVQALMDEIGKVSEGFNGEQAVAALEQLNRIATGK